MERTASLHAQPIPRREEEVSHRVGAGDRSLLEHLDQLAARVEQDPEELGAHATVLRRVGEYLHREDEERLPVIEPIVPRLHLGLGERRLGTRGGLARDVGDVDRDDHAHAVAVDRRVERAERVERGQDALRALVLGGGADQRFRLFGRRRQVVVERPEALFELALHELKGVVRERARLAVEVARFDVERGEPELPVAPDDRPRRQHELALPRERREAEPEEAEADDRRPRGRQAELAAVRRERQLVDHRPVTIAGRAPELERSVVGHAEVAPHRRLEDRVVDDEGERDSGGARRSHRDEDEESQEEESQDEAHRGQLWARAPAGQAASDLSPATRSQRRVRFSITARGTSSMPWRAKSAACRSYSASMVVIVVR